MLFGRPFRRRNATASNVTELHSRAIEQVTGVQERLIEARASLDILESIQSIALHRARRKVEVLHYAGQSYDVREIVRQEIGDLQAFIGALSEADPPLSAPDVERELRAFVEGAR